MTADDMPMSSSDATTAKAAIDALNSNLSSLSDHIGNMYTSFNDYSSVDCTTSLTYTGMSITIPAGSYYCIFASCLSSTTAPEIISICASNSMSFAAVASGSYIGYVCSAVECNYEPSETKRYVWVKCSGIGKCNVKLQGFYIKP
jgi:hypothetical protein